ncbi:hypothetical protein COCC4DRAFT_63086 [Bipolaris maydis ATCC 48331]|uniref:Uncharacterized protein n=2 Tax=Cochliobolus heterostrophus TaxID=5016 RepID=M2UHE8_COCH5|nr:uncharacterized protein COCC4DRAFT_63086 [Bipolaris maydis ATCC 48331]EMD97869.1 hypothetical protein COCHEDRAFT_1026206 [Bipolaris maydis C5]KAJ5031933.1 hypothetical protein J3E73DRAFT_252899 [Bipolaris maydis]ENI02734.1 hypothetical protein COCC4DRAFT_63086 [Bipolaris maydis ATCC 48331]KAJ5060004.1 hypothetical protein J3E74DRAFT_290305 [Bipolaris maydis]KAJ6210794.1 hypothetical protein PSV09DRAFT_1026206 [Bipolaris maydis]
MGRGFAGQRRGNDQDRKRLSLDRVPARRVRTSPAEARVGAVGELVGAPKVSHHSPTAKHHCAGTSSAALAIAQANASAILFPHNAGEGHMHRSPTSLVACPLGHWPRQTQCSAAVWSQARPSISTHTRKKMKILRQLRRAMWNLVVPNATRCSPANRTYHGPVPYTALTRRPLTLSIACSRSTSVARHLGSARGSHHLEHSITHSRRSQR